MYNEAMSKTIIKIISTVLFLLAILIAFVVYGLFNAEYNSAKVEADRVMESFSEATDSNLYCENGSGDTSLDVGFGGQKTAEWWEEIHLSENEFNATVMKTENYLVDKGYAVNTSLVEDASYLEDGSEFSDQSKTYWNLNGSSSEYLVEVRISSNELTHNRCKSGSNVDTVANPKQSPSVIVIEFKEII
jgi:hypothetical protein